MRILLMWLLLVTSSSGIGAGTEVPGGAFLERYCIDCHAGDDAKGGLDLEALSRDLSDPGNRRRWVKVHDQVEAGEMPPKKKTRPDAVDRRKFLVALGEAIGAADRSDREVVLRRLNRNEYENTVCDLFGIRVDLQRDLPGEDREQGFDNTGSDLSISGEQMLIYLEVADLVLDAVFGPPKKPESIRQEIRFGEFRERDRADRLTAEGGLLFGKRSVPIWDSGVPGPGTYRFRVRARAVQSDAPLYLRVHGGVTGNISAHLAGYLEVPPGDMVTLELTDRALEPYDAFMISFPEGWPFWELDAEKYRGPGILVEKVEIEGPLEEWPPASRKRLLGELNPARGTSRELRSIISRILPKAFRREVTASEAEPYISLAVGALEDGVPFEAALRRGLKAMLCAPEFLFLEEGNPLDDHAVACRLSYFLWNSLPDEELSRLAARGELSRPAVLAGQVERLLKDGKSERFVENFTDQWLRLRDIDFTVPNSDLYPEYSELLRRSMLAETRAFFREILEKDLGVRHFIDSDFAMINGPLASLYGIGGVTGLGIRRVDLPADSVRGGVLTQASVLKVSADGTRTSPVLRGAWILKHFFGTPPEPPPPGVTAVEPDIRGATTIREQIALHREHESCHRCHARIDPPGFALECFDVIGARRDWYRAWQGGYVDRRIHPFSSATVNYRRGREVDTSGVMPDGRKFSGVRDYKKLLLEDEPRMARSLTRLLLTYALGRNLGFSDRPEVEAIVGRLEDRDYGLRSMIREIVLGDAFRSP